MLNIYQELETISNSMLPKVNIRVLIMPEECKDINDLLCAGYELADLPTEHIDIFVIKQLVKRYKTIEEQYVVAESFLKTIRSPMIRAEAIQALGEIWNRDVSDLKAYFDSGVSSEQDLLETLHDASSSLNQLRDIYKRGTYPTHFQLLDKLYWWCIKRTSILNWCVFIKWQSLILLLSISYDR